MGAAAVKTCAVDSREKIAIRRRLTARRSCFESAKKILINTGFNYS